MAQSKINIDTPKGLLGKAISYAMNQWDRLVRYTEQGFAKPDNNNAENAIRPFVVGRKNWLFSGNPEGARASAALFSLIETAKANELEPYNYLRYLFERLPVAETTEDFKSLLPQYLSPEQLKLNALCDLLSAYTITCQNYLNIQFARLLA